MTNTAVLESFKRMRNIIISLIFIFAVPFSTFSQDSCCWYHLDPENDQVMGISTYRAYEYLKGRHADTVIVAVIDNGAEITHKDLKDVIWTNKGEIPGNGIDDDKNGYIDDIHGWNFLGNNREQNLKRDNTSLTRMYARLEAEYNNSNGLMTEDDYTLYQKVCKEYFLEVDRNIDWLNKLYQKKEDFLKKGTVVPIALQKKINDLKEDLNTRLNPQCSNRKDIVGDDPDNRLDSIYGNNMIDAGGPYHGTGVAGIIGAVDHNTGIHGVARHVKLMILRIVPNGDERDKDVALAILYAVRNGASVINCSFAKEYSEHPEFVQQAIREAEARGVLIVHGAGNKFNNNDIHPYYPEGKTGGEEIAPNWINAGASNKEYNEHLISWFSNYGKKTVDVFAPGEGIMSLALNNGYSSGSGTSLAAPIVSGIAAELKSYYPHLTAVQLKQIIVKSVFPLDDLEVQLFDRPCGESVKVKDLCVSGGIVNFYRAVLLADKYFSLQNQEK